MESIENNKKNFEELLIRERVVGFFEEPMILKSGKESSWYVNCRALSQSWSGLDNVSGSILDFLQNEDLLEGIDAVVGVPEGATLLGQQVSRSITDTVYAPRSRPKEHGDPANKYWTNGNVPSRIIVLEDVTTTGGSAIDFVNQIKTSGIEVVAVVGLVNRLQMDDGKTVEQKMQDINMPYFAMTDAAKILPKVLEKMGPAERDILRGRIMSEYANEYGGNAPFNL